MMKNEEIKNKKAERAVKERKETNLKKKDNQKNQF